NTRSHTTSGRSLKRRYTVWKPRFDIPTKYVFGNASATRSRPPCGFRTKPISRERTSACFMATEIVRESELKRRRWRLPWIYLVYHVRERREDRGNLGDQE